MAHLAIVYFVYLSISFHNLISKFWMIQNDLFISHFLNCIIMVALNRVVVLVDLNTKPATGCEVVWLWKMAKSMMLHGLKNVVNSHPLSPCISWSTLTCLGPDLIKAGYNEGSSFNLKR